MNTDGKRPTHRLVLVDKDNTKNKTIAGSAWMNDDETFASITLRPGVVISAAEADRYWLNFVKNDVPFRGSPSTQNLPGAPAFGPLPDDDDDITF